MSVTVSDEFNLSLEPVEELEEAIFLTLANAALADRPEWAGTYDQERINSYVGQLTRWIRERMIEVPYRPPLQAKE